MANILNKVTVSTSNKFAAKNVIFLISCNSSVASSKSINNVITEPLKWQKKMAENLGRKQQEHIRKQSKQGNIKNCIISCKNSAFNHYLGQSYGKFDKIPLASRFWDHRKANNDYFVINSHAPNPSILQSGEDFASLNVISEAITAGLASLGFTKPTLIQKLACKSILQGDNCLIAAETGSGKTLSYLVPMIQQVLELKGSPLCSQRPLNAPLVIVLTPGRELCEQIAEVAEKLIEKLPTEQIKTHFITGGRLKRDMLNPEYREVDLLFASFGAISKLTTTGLYDTSRVQHIILDEADTLLDDSFSGKLLRFLRKFPLQMTRSHSNPEGVQLIMASATIPRSAEEILSDVIPYESFNKITTDNLHRLLPHVPQKFLRLSHLDKPSSLLDLVKRDVSRKLPVIVFSNHTDRCNWISMFLNENGISCVNLNGDMNQHFRQNRFSEYQSGKHMVLACTDVVSRGLDTVSTHHVINYDVPTNVSDYIHRCGRVGRVGSSQASGVVTTLVCHRSEVELVQKIEFAARQTNLNELPNVNANIKRMINNQVLRK